ncbi:hypothetical protein [Enteractinococcus helveticum]|nr:hypothetical protein [Enteractinococcus helveticum]
MSTSAGRIYTRQFVAGFDVSDSRSEDWFTTLVGSVLPERVDQPSVFSG